MIHSIIQTLAASGLGNSSSSYLKSCLWDQHANRYCPVFRIKDILSAAGVEDFERDVMVNGAVITVQIKYSCNLDVNTETCSPEYDFTRIDEPNNAVGIAFNHPVLGNGGGGMACTPGHTETEAPMG